MVNLSKVLNFLLLLWIVSVFYLGLDFYELYADTSIKVMLGYLSFQGLIFASSLFYCLFYRKLRLYPLGLVTFFGERPNYLSSSIIFIY